MMRTSWKRHHLHLDLNKKEEFLLTVVKYFKKNGITSIKVLRKEKKSHFSETQSWRDSTMSKVFAMHVASPGCILSTKYNFLSTTRSDL